MAASAPSSSAAFSHLNIPKHYLSQNQRSSCMRSMATQTSKLISHYKLSITSRLHNSHAQTNSPSSSSASSLVSSSSSPASVHQLQELATPTRSASKAGAVQEMYVYELNENDRNSPAYLPFSLKFDFSKGLPTGAIGDLIPLTNKMVPVRRLSSSLEGSPHTLQNGSGRGCFLQVWRVVKSLRGPSRPSRIASEAIVEGLPHGKMPKTSCVREKGLLVQRPS